jgi:hypothetical protein
MLGSACNDQGSPTETAAPPRPILRTSQNPEGPGAQVIRSEGAQVIRGEGALAFIFPDPANGLTLTAGFTQETLDAFCAQEPFVGQPSTIHGVLRPDGTVTDLTKAKNVTLLVFVGNQDICAGPPFAVGQGSFLNHDNDLFVSLNRANSFGFRVVGQVTDVNGDRHQVSASFHGVIDRGGELRITRTGVTLR